MSDKQKLLKVKATLKKRQPTFIRQDAHKHKRVKQVWRKPKGLHSKMKDSRKGYRVKLQEGYHTPRAVRGMDKHGLYPTIVATLAELASLDPAKHSIILKGTLGGRKRVIILEEAIKRKFTLANATAKTAEEIKSKFAKRSEENKAKTVAKKEKHKVAVEKADKKKNEKLDEKADGDKKDEKKSDEKHDHDHKHDHAHDKKHGSHVHTHDDKPV